MAKANESTVREIMGGGGEGDERKYSTYKTGIPKAIGDAMRLKDQDRLEWLLVGGDVVVRKI